MSPKHDLESIAGVQVCSLRYCEDGTIIGAVRLTRDLPAVYATIHQQGWTVARSADEAPDVANALAFDPVPADVLLVKRDTAIQADR